MAYYEGLVERVRDTLAGLGRGKTRERNVFGGRGFLASRSTFAIVFDDELIVKLPRSEYDLGFQHRRVGDCFPLEVVICDHEHLLGFTFELERALDPGGGLRCPDGSIEARVDFYRIEVSGEVRELVEAAWWGRGRLCRTSPCTTSLPGR